MNGSGDWRSLQPNGHFSRTVISADGHFSRTVISAERLFEPAVTSAELIFKIRKKILVGENNSKYKIVVRYSIPLAIRYGKSKKNGSGPFYNSRL